MVVKVLGRERGDRWGVGCGTLIIRGWGWGGWRQQECSHILTRVVCVRAKGVPGYHQIYTGVYLKAPGCTTYRSRYVEVHQM